MYIKLSWNSIWKLNDFLFEKIPLLFDIKNWLWKYDFGTFWQTVITHRIFLKIFPWWHVDSWPKSLLLRTHHLWNSLTELILMYRLKFTPCPPLNKGYLIWESFLSSKKCSKSLSWVLSAGENAQDSDLEPFLEIKSPLQIPVQKKVNPLMANAHHHLFVADVVKVVNLQGKLKSSKRQASELFFDFSINSIGEYRFLSLAHSSF